MMMGQKMSNLCILLCHKGFAPSFCRSVLMVSALAICKLHDSPSELVKAVATRGG